MKSGKSAARTAYGLTQWFAAHAQELAAPLATCRLLMSPSEAELPQVGEYGGDATLETVLRALGAWRRDAASNPDNMALLYLVGLGIERPDGEHLFLLEDFGDRVGPLLRNTIALSTVVAGMAPSLRQPDIARTQLYVIDASRRRPRQDLSFNWDNTTAVFDPETVGPDDRAVMTIFAAAPGGPAYAGSKHGSFLGQALIRSLEGEAAELVGSETDERWAVTLGSLVRTLPRQVRELSASLEPQQQVVVAGSFRDAPVLFLEAPPVVELALSVEGTAAGSPVRVQLRDRFGVVALERSLNLPDDTIDGKFPAGLYVVSVEWLASGSSQMNTHTAPLMLQPPTTRWVLNLRSIV